MDIQPDIIRTAHGLETGPADASTGRIRDQWEWALVDVGLVLLLLVIPHGIFSDGAIRYRALSELLEHRPITPTFYSLVGPLFSTPFYYLGKLAFGSDWWCARFNTFLLAGGLAATAALLRRSVDGRVLRTFLLLIVAASMFPNHVRGYFGEMFTTVCVFVGIAALSVGRPRLGWTVMVVGVANAPAALVGLLFVAVRHVRETRRLRHFFAVAVATLLIMLESWIRRGHPLVSGYEGNSFVHTVMPYSGGPGFNYPLFFGVLSVLFSFGKGLLFFAPGLLLPIRKDERDVPNALRAFWAYSMWFVAGLIVVYARWWSWYGGWVWGPRFYLAASVPASVAIAVKLRKAAALRTPTLIALLAILMMSMWVGISGAVFDKDNLLICTENAWALEFLCWYTPEFSVLWHPFIDRSPLSFDQGLFIVYCALVYVWLAGPVARILMTRASESIAGARQDLRALRF